MTTLNATIRGTGSVTPGRCVTTAEVAERIGRPSAAAKYEQRTGIKTRWWADEGVSVAEVAAEAVARALTRAGVDAKQLSSIILTHSGMTDLLVPSTANRVAARLGLRGSCDCYDLNNACMGFLTAVDIASRAVVTGKGPIAVVSAELTSRGIRSDERRPYLVHGDAVAAAIVDKSRDDDDDAILATFLANDGGAGDLVFALHPANENRRTFIQYAAASDDITTLAFAGLRRGLDGILTASGAKLDEIEWVLPHQPNGAMLDGLIDAFGLDANRVVRVVDEIGSVASASIPMSLDRLLRTRPVKRGDRILMFGVGSGVSFGSMLYRVGAGTLR